MDAAELRDLLADADRDVRAIVITGAGRGFCSGLDLKDATSTGIGSGGGSGLGRFDLRNAPPMVLHNTDKPTLCALNGPAAGYGMDLALGCDIRVASETAKLAAVFTKRSLLPESGGTCELGNSDGRRAPFGSEGADGTGGGVSPGSANRPGTRSARMIIFGECAPKKTPSVACRPLISSTRKPFRSSNARISSAVTLWPGFGTIQAQISSP